MAGTYKDEFEAALVVQVAAMVVSSHDAGKRCQMCTDSGCSQVPWARDILEQHRADRAAFRKRAETW